MMSALLFVTLSSQGHDQIVKFLRLGTHQTIAIQASLTPVLFVGPVGEVIIGYKPRSQWVLKTLRSKMREVTLGVDFGPLYCGWDAQGSKLLVGDGSTCEMRVWPSGRLVKSISRVGLCSFRSDGSISSLFRQDELARTGRALLPASNGNVILERGPQGKFRCYYGTADGKKVFVQQLQDEYADIPAFITNASSGPVLQLVDRGVYQYKYWALGRQGGQARASEIVSTGGLKVRWNYYPPFQNLRYVVGSESSALSSGRTAVLDLQTKRQLVTPVRVAQVLTDRNSKVQGIIIDKTPAAIAGGSRDFEIWVPN